MKKLLFLLLVLSTPILYGQNCGYRLEVRVVAESGLTLRQAPNLKAKVLGYAPFDATLEACEQTFGALRIEGINGHWRKVRFQEQAGFMYDGFLEITGMKSTDSLRAASKRLMAQADSVLSLENSALPAKEAKEPMIPEDQQPYLNQASEWQVITEAYNFCGAVNQLDPGLLWYGVYPAEENGTPYFRLKKVELAVALSKRRMSESLEFDITTNQEERSIFLFGLNRPWQAQEVRIKDHTEALRYAGRKIFPGQSISLVGSGYTLEATGTVIQAGDCPELKDYSLYFKGLKKQVDLLNLLGEGGACGMPELYWYGDLSGDGIPELILVTEYQNRTTFHFLHSFGKELLEIGYRFSVKNCE